MPYRQWVWAKTICLKRLKQCLIHEIRGSTPTKRKPMIGKEDGLCSSRSYLFSLGVTTKKSKKRRYGKKGSLWLEALSFLLLFYLLFSCKEKLKRTIEDGLAM